MLLKYQLHKPTRREQGRLVQWPNSAKRKIYQSALPGCCCSVRTNHIVCGLEPQISGMPVIPEDELIPGRNQVRNGTARGALTEGDTTIHTSSSRDLKLLRLESTGHFLPVFGPLPGRPVRLSHPLVLHKSTDLVELRTSSDSGFRIDHGILNISDGRLVMFDADGTG